MAKTRKATTAARGSRAVRKKKRAPSRTRASYTTVDVEIRNGIALLALARPDVHNAFNAALIAEMTAALAALERDDAVRAVVLLAHGKSFCAGADLNWMREMAAYGDAENLADATALATMLKTLNELSKPTIARVHGAAYGGGVGLIACCDIAIAAQDATFSLSEARLGLIPATIGPYVIDAIGARSARRYFLTAERFTAAEAYRIGLVHDIAIAEALDDRINELLGDLIVAGPCAQAESKALIRAVARRPVDDAMVADTASRIARIRASAEAREGVAAFLAKRKPAWVPVAPEEP